MIVINDARPGDNIKHLVVCTLAFAHGAQPKEATLDLPLVGSPPSGGAKGLVALCLRWWPMAGNLAI